MALVGFALANLAFVQQSSMFSMTVNSTDPVWLYCSQTYASHCQAGQVMVINPL